MRSEACPEWDEDLSAYLDGELAAERAAEVRAHVSACAGCSARLDALRRVDALLEEAPAPAVPADLGARLRARLAEEEGAGARARTPVRRGPPRRRLRTFAAAAAAAAAAVVLYLVAGPRTAPLGEPPASAPRVARRVPPAPPETPAVRPAPPAPPGPAPDATGSLALDAISEAEMEEIAIALELDTMRDLEVIANLELLEALVEPVEPVERDEGGTG